MPADLRKARELFLHAVGQLPPEQWDGYVVEACGGDVELAQQVRHFLQVHLDAGSFLDRPAAGVAATGAFAPEPGEGLDAPDRERPGAVFGPYKLVGPIGEGGMGTVWIAQQTEPVRRLVALKVIKAGMDSKQVIARFEAERQALALMDHPNIAQIHDGGTTSDGRPYFVMDLVKGVPITRYCDEHHLTPRQRLELFVGVCSAVQHAHQKGIIHRDLKPSNVLVALYDGKPVPKVIDFGVAKAAGQTLTDKTLVTGFGNIVGTLEYMSPEQAEVNQLDIDTRSDIYSLGVLLYELLTGSPPFTRKELEKAGMLEMLRVIREQEPSKPSTKLSTAEGLPTLAANRGTEPAKLTRLVRGELDWIVMKALEKDRNRRYETANGFAQDLQRYLADEPVLACPPSHWYRFRKFTRRNKRALATAGGVLFVLVLIGGGTGWVLRDRANRLAATAHQVEQALTEAEELAQGSKLYEAVLTARKAEAILHSGGNQDLRHRVGDLLTDLGLAEELEEARLGGIELKEDATSDLENTVRAYAKTFRAYGIDAERLPPAEAAERIRRRATRGQLTFALDHWGSLPIVTPETKQRLLAIVAEVDTDAWRRQVRAAAERDAKALQKLAAAPEVLSQPPVSLILLGSYLHRHGDIDTAAKLLEKAQRRYPGHFWINQNLAFYLMLSKPARLDRAIRFLTTAVALRPQSPGARLKLGWALQRSGGSIDEARAAYEAAIALKPDYALAHFALAKFLIDPVQDYEGAIVELSKSLQLRPEHVGSRVNRAGMYLLLKQWSKALEDCTEGIKLTPKMPFFRVARAEALQGLGQRDQAILACSQAIELDPDYIPAWNRRGELHLALEQLEMAVADLSKSIELSSGQWKPHLFRAMAHKRLRQWDKAAADYSLLIETAATLGINPPWQDRGWVYAEAGRWPEAMADFERLVKSQPDQPVYWYHHGMACLGAKDEKAYRAVCAGMLERFAKTTDPTIAGRVVVTCVAAPGALTDPDRLVPLAELACSGNRVVNVGLLGAAHYRAGDFSRALARCTEMPRSPPRAWDWLFQAMAHHRLGEIAAARDCFGRAEQWLAVVGPPGPDDPRKPRPRWYNWQEELSVRLLRREVLAFVKATEGKQHSGEGK